MPNPARDHYANHLHTRPPEDPPEPPRYGSTEQCHAVEDALAFAAETARSVGADAMAAALDSLGWGWDGHRKEDAEQPDVWMVGAQARECDELEYAARWRVEAGR